jgi:hypothetical protein
MDSRGLLWALESIPFPSFFAVFSAFSCHGSQYIGIKTFSTIHAMRSQQSHASRSSTVERRGKRCCKCLQPGHRRGRAQKYRLQNIFEMRSIRSFLFTIPMDVVDGNRNPKHGRSLSSLQAHRNKYLKPGAHMITARVLHL